MAEMISPRVVVVTGGTRGIGLAVTERFLQAGDRVAVCSRSARPAGLPSEVLHHVVDVRQRAEVDAFLDAVTARVGPIDVLINNAGASGWRPIAAVDAAIVADVLDSVLLGTIWCSASAAERMRGPGAIVNVSSLAGKRGSANNSVYCAAKFGVNGVTQSLAKELGPRGIRVNAVCPVYVLTDQVQDALTDPASPAGGAPVDGYLAQFAATQTALGRLPTAEEVAEAVYFLSSASASAITGQCVNVDCGVMPQ
jgi:3-oxoacyl-[acyl-carrier protein] reductase/meso-butanediol dehydrogenase/(S,S)-butanediol dehydrogenase/diacetyl reductase